MTDDERGRLFIELKAARDKAKGDLCLARRQAKQLIAHLAIVQRVLEGEDGIGWRKTEHGLRFGPPNLMDGRLLTDEEVFDVLDTIQSSEQTIQEYDEFVK